MRNPFRYFKTSPEIIRLAVMMYIRFPLSLRNVEDLLHERGIDVTHETVRFWWNRFGPLFARSIRKRRVENANYSSWAWHLDEVFVKINGELHYLWRAVDHEGEVLEAFVTKRRDRKAALKFLRKAMKRYGNPKIIVTDRLGSYKAAMRQIGNAGCQEMGRWLNNRAENSHQPLRRREKIMNRFRSMRSLQKFAAVQSSIHNHFNLERHFCRRPEFKKNRTAALAEWRELVACFRFDPGLLRPIRFCLTPPPLRPAGLVSFHELAISLPSFRGLRSRVWNRDRTNALKYPRKARKSQTASLVGPSTIPGFPDVAEKQGFEAAFVHGERLCAR